MYAGEGDCDDFMFKGVAKIGSLSQCNQLIMSRYIIVFFISMISKGEGGSTKYQGEQSPLACTPIKATGGGAAVTMQGKKKRYIQGSETSNKGHSERGQTSQ